MKVLQINRTTTFMDNITSPNLSFVPIADIIAFHIERPFSNAERNLLIKPSSFCLFLSFILESLASIQSDVLSNKV